MFLKPKTSQTVFFLSKLSLSRAAAVIEVTKNSISFDPLTTTTDTKTKTMMTCPQ